MTTEESLYKNTAWALCVTKHNFNYHGTLLTTTKFHILTTGNFTTQKARIHYEL